MRFLGFLTGIALLAILYVVITDTQVYPGNKNELANNIKEMLNNGAKQDRNSTKKPIKTETKTTGHPTPKNDSKHKGSINKQSINRPRKSVKSIPPKDKIIVLKSNTPDQSVESEKLSIVMRKPKKNNPSRKVETKAVEKNPEMPKNLASPSNVSPSDQVQLHSFWGPFRTRISARGFAENLTKRTSIKLEIVEPRPGAFMIAYPYDSEDQRQKIAALIEQRSGLKLSDY